MFPYIANDRNAYSLYWFPFNTSIAKYFPFDTTNLPKYVFIDTSYSYLPSFLDPLLFNKTFYGIPYFIYSKNYPGSIYLFEKNYKGKTTIISNQNIPNNLTIYPQNLFLGESGRLANIDKSNGSTILMSNYSTLLTPNSINIWRGPFITLLPGNYIAKFTLSAIPTNIQISKNATVLYLRGSADMLNYYLYNVTLNFSQLENGWHSYIVKFKILQPLTNIQFLGYYYGPYDRITGGQIHIMLKKIYVKKY